MNNDKGKGEAGLILVLALLGLLAIVVLNMSANLR